MQKGSLMKSKRQNGQTVWEFRWRDRTSGKPVYRRIVLGTTQQFGTEDTYTQSVTPAKREAGAAKVLCSGAVKNETTAFCDKLFRMVAGTTGLEPAASAVTVTEIKRCRRTSFDTVSHGTILLIVPLMSPSSWPSSS